MSIRTRQNYKKTQELSKQYGLSIQSTLSKIQNSSIQQNNFNRKKDKLNLKRKIKEQPIKENSQKTNADNSSTELNQSSKSQQQLLNSNSLVKDYSILNDDQQDHTKDIFLLQKIIRKPNCIKIQQNSMIKGYSGHSSIIFKRPILQGAFYFEVKILNSNKDEQNLLFESSIRIGLCPHNYSHTIPLGGKGSIGYRNTDGMMIENKKAKNFGQSYGQGDIIGVEINISSPHKYPVKQERNQGSKIAFYKNREKVGEYSDLKQIFYCVGISLYNCANIKLNIKQNDIQYLPQGYQPYIQYLNKQIMYKDLKNSQIFND